MPNFLLLLVDGLAVAYRAYHAIPNLTSRSGEPTNALFGFIKAVRQLDEQFRPTHRAVVFDGGLPDERMALLPSYKAQRDPMPDALKKQLDPMVAFLEMAGWSPVRPEGQEADDAMATLACRAEQMGGHVLMASSDKDLMQLISDRVRMVAPVKAALPMGPPEVKAKLGVPPEAVVDWLALVGDTADNIPGVPGIGPRTAAQLLNEFGSLASLWANLERVSSPRIKALLVEHRAAVERNCRLMLLRVDLPGLPDIDHLTTRRPDVARLIPFLEQRDLGSIARSYADKDMELF